MGSTAKAPRFESYINRSHFGDRSVFTWPKNQWDAISGPPEQTVLLDVTETPMSSVAAQASVLACEAMKYASSDGRILIYREDLADGSTPINKDSYSVWQGESLKSLPNIEQLALACGTSADPNLYRFLEENVFVVKEEPGNDHWLSELPESVQIKLQKE